MKTTPIRTEVLDFLKTTGISARGLAREAGVSPSSVLHLTCGGRKDVVSATADKLRAAMARLSRKAKRAGAERQDPQEA